MLAIHENINNLCLKVSIRQLHNSAPSGPRVSRLQFLPGLKFTIQSPTRKGSVSMRSYSRLVHLLFGFVVAVNCLVGAQTGTTSLRGTVSDKSDAAITGAKVT